MGYRLLRSVQLCDVAVHLPVVGQGLGKFTSQGSGILIMMVVGGAIIPEIQGFLADRFGYQLSFAIVLLCYAYILFFALRGHRNQECG